MTQRQIRSIASLIIVVVVAVAGYYQNQQQGGNSPLGGNNCQDEFRAGQPTTAVASRLLCRNEYISVYDPARKVPLVVAEHLSSAELVQNVKRSDNFQPDPELPSGERAELSDYRASGYDRGHMAPAADFEAGQIQMDQSFYLSNMVPQNGEMNRGVWARLEGATRDCARQLGGLYILTGPIFSGRARTIGPDKVAVPSALYKVVVSGAAVRAFVLPNRSLPDTSSFAQYETPLADVQSATGLTFFPSGGIDTSAPGTFCAGSFGG
jgi:endonuclease G, mitochondrial